MQRTVLSLALGCYTAILCLHLMAWTQDPSNSEAPSPGPRVDRLKKAQELVALMDYPRLFTTMIQQWPFDPLSAVLDQMGAENLSPERKQTVQQWIDEFRKKQLKRFDLAALEKTLAEVMAEVYTLDELQGLIGFYQSPIGQAYLKKQPEFTRRMAAAYESIISKDLGDLLTQSMLHVDTLRKLILHGTVENEEAQNTSDAPASSLPSQDEEP
jgi:hypothetical protein